MDGSRVIGIEKMPKIMQNEATWQAAEKEVAKQTAEKENFQQIDNIQNSMPTQHKEYADDIDDIKTGTSKKKRKISKKRETSIKEIQSVIYTNMVSSQRQQKV